MLLSLSCAATERSEPSRLSALDVPALKSVSSLAVNCYVLELIHEQFLGFYDQIDFDRIRRGLERHDAEYETDDEVLALSCRDLACDDADATQTPAAERVDRSANRIRPLRLDKFLRLLQGMGCEIRGCRGSEVAVCRAVGLISGHRALHLELHPLAKLTSGDLHERSK